MTVRQTLFTVPLAFCLTCPVWAQTPQVSDLAAAPASTPFDVGAFMNGSNLESLLQITENLRLAATSLDRFGKSMELAGGAAASTGQHMASMSREFDPFGYKQAFQTIQQQNRTIRRMQRQIETQLQLELAQAASTKTEPSKRRNARRTDTSPRPERSSRRRSLVKMNEADPRPSAAPRTGRRNSSNGPRPADLPSKSSTEKPVETF